MGLPGIHGAGGTIAAEQQTGEMLDCWLDITFSDTQGSGQVGGVSLWSPVLLYCPVFIANNNHYSSAPGNKINIITIHLN